MFAFAGNYVMVMSVSFLQSSTGNPPFWIPIHIVIPERPTECAVFNVIAGILMLIHLIDSWMLQFTVLFVLFDFMAFCS